MLVGALQSLLCLVEVLGGVAIFERGQHDVGHEDDSVPASAGRATMQLGRAKSNTELVGLVGARPARPLS